MNPLGDNDYSQILPPQVALYAADNNAEHRFKQRQKQGKQHARSEPVNEARANVPRHGIGAEPVMQRKGGCGGRAF